MRTASLILGIISFVISLIPGIGFIAITTAILGFIFGIVGIIQKQGSKTQAIVGLVLSILSFLIMVFWVFVLIIFSYEAMPIEEYTEIESVEIKQKVEEYFAIGEDIKLDNVVLRLDNLSETLETTPKDGYKFVCYNISLKNITGYTINYSPLDFTIEDKYGNIYESDYTKIECNTTLQNGKLKSNEVVKGIICFEIPDDLKNFVIHFDNEKDIASIKI